MHGPSGLATRTGAGGQAAHAARLRVLMITEGTYPYHFGGVSTWCHSLIRGLPNVDFDVLSIISDPRLELQFALPPNVRELRSVPLWGIIEAREAHRDFSVPDVLRQRATSDHLVRTVLVPILDQFLT